MSTSLVPDLAPVPTTGQNRPEPPFIRRIDAPRIALAATPDHTQPLHRDISNGLSMTTEPTEPTEPNSTKSKTKRRIKKSATKRHFIQLSIHAVDQIITLNTKSPTAFSMLLLMASKCNHLNTLFVLQNDLAILLNVSIKTVIEAVKILETGDWITRPLPHTYQINAAAFWTAERAMIRNAPHYASITPKPKTDTLTHIPHLTPKTQPKPRNETTVFERFQTHSTT